MTKEMNMYQRPRPDLLLRGGFVLDVATGERTRRDIGVQSGHIVEVGDLVDPVILPAEEATVLFGLWDCHCHPGSLMHDPTGESYFETAPMHAMRGIANLSDALRAGVTGVRVLGEVDDIDIAMARATARGELVGPRIAPSGVTLHTTGGHGQVFPRAFHRVTYFDEIDGADSVRRSVRSHVEHGATWIKVLITGGLFSDHEEVDDSQFDDEELRVLLQTAASRSIPVAAHCGSARMATKFAKGGGRSIEHGYALDEEAAAAMAANGTWLVPTISVSHDDEMMIEGGWPQHSLERAQKAAHKHREALHACLEAGVQIALGADLNPVGMRTHREMELLESVGMTRLDVLRAATAGGRELNGLGSSTTPTAGDAADLIVVDGNPMDDMKALQQPRHVVAHGRIATGGIG